MNPKDYLGKFWLDSLVHDPKMLAYIIDLVGVDRVALGSDYPFPLGETPPGELIKSKANNKLEILMEPLVSLTSHAFFSDVSILNAKKLLSFYFVRKTRRRPLSILI